MLHRQDRALSQSLLTLREAVKELRGIPEFRQRTHLAALTMSTEPSVRCSFISADTDEASISSIKSDFFTDYHFLDK
jgi:hypothetical protein